MKDNFKRLVIGGTFDLLHSGHKKFLSKAFEVADFVVIGLTSDKFNSVRGKSTLQNQTEREKALTEFLTNQGYSNKFSILIINNIEGETLEDEKLEAMLVTDDTKDNAMWINKQRLQKGLKPLELIEIDLLKDDSDKAISSSRIREGQVSASGIVYKTALSKIVGTKLAERIRHQIKSPQGKLLKSIREIKNQDLIIVVGDITCKSFYENNIIPKIAIIDFKTKREVMFSNLSDLNIVKENADYIVPNPSGEISFELINAIEKAINSNLSEQIILVKGEEDLAVIPTVLLCPIGAKVYYGQPDQGIVEIEVDQAVKSRVLKLIADI